MDVAREKVSRKEVLMPQAFERNILELRCRLDPALLCFTRFELPNCTQDGLRLNEEFWQLYVRDIHWLQFGFRLPNTGLF